MTYDGLVALLERLIANAEEHGRHRDAMELRDTKAFIDEQDGWCLTCHKAAHIGHEHPYRPKRCESMRYPG